MYFPIPLTHQEKQVPQCGLYINECLYSKDLLTPCYFLIPCLTLSLAKISYHSARKRTKLVKHATAWMILERCYTERKKWRCKSLSCVCLFVIPGTVACQAPLLSRQDVGSPVSRGSSQSRDWTQVSCLAGGFFTIWAPGEALWATREWAIIYTVWFYMNTKYILYSIYTIYSKDKSLVIQLLQPSCRTLEKFYKIASSNEENSRSLPWKYEVMLMPINGGLTMHLSKRLKNECPGHIDLYIFNIPKFMSWKYFCFLKAATNWECKAVCRNWASVALKLKYSLQRTVFNVEGFHQHCWSLVVKLHTSVSTLKVCKFTWRSPSMAAFDPMHCYVLHGYPLLFYIVSQPFKQQALTSKRDRAQVISLL